MIDSTDYDIRMFFKKRKIETIFNAACRGGIEIRPCANFLFRQLSICHYFLAQGNCHTHPRLMFFWRNNGDFAKLAHNFCQSVYAKCGVSVIIGNQNVHLNLIKMVKLGINGFGRIGRMVFRAAVENFSKDIEVVGINDLLDPDYLAYMLKYDSVHGKFDHDIKIDGNTMTVDGKKIRLTAEMDPANLKWNEVGATVVVESTGLFLVADDVK